ncbi:villin-5 [Dendrobium catenatum]|uniref:Villin-4 n=1 Tax=Dendrobium catenatum TaxID=906689 RepID=A0A2I0VRS8_9ASPA|nr:villin-5 [Dendrobium catenatum]XP_020683907.1 villin-5 [Dendrobium catenatum]XP_020683908.1 villin-5 [Dendrobium catenatum]PKU66116.1 Villin-4 [Dendrobium catenatum]
MAVSMREVDPAFQGAGQKAGLEIWRIENFQPVAVPKSSYGKFFTGDAYVILKTTALKSGALRNDIHYWLGENSSQDEAGAAAIKTVELDAALGGRAVQYREVQGHETDRFLSYFKPCIIPQSGGMASGFKHVEVNEHDHKTRMFLCEGKHAIRVKEVPFARSSLNHDGIFILDTKSKIFQFNGSNSSIQERAKALEVVQYVKDAYHEGKCDVATVEDGKLMADADAGEFWGLFGGFAPLPRRTSDDNVNGISPAIKLFSIEKGQPVPVVADKLVRQLLDTNKCYLLDCGFEVFVWMGRSTSLEERKSASASAEELSHGPGRPKVQIIRVIEGFETTIFRAKFDTWPRTVDVSLSEDGRGKVAALLKRQGVNVKGLMKASPVKEEPQPYIDCTGNLQVWRVSGNEKYLLSSSEQSMFYSGDCYIFQYSFPGNDKEEYLLGTWFGKESTLEERSAAVSLATNMVESLKSQAVQARIYEGKEPIQFLSIFQSLIVFKGGMSSGYKKFRTENGLEDETYTPEGIALFRVQGCGPDNMQAIQVNPVSSSLNSSYCYILHSGNTVFTWSGSLTTSNNQELVERQLDMIKPNIQPKPQKEGSESEQFWSLLGGKCEYPSQNITREPESDPHLFSCTFSNGNLKVSEIHNFTQDDLMAEDVFILYCHSDIFVWVGQQVDAKTRLHALNIGEKFLEQDFLMENVSLETPIFVIMEGSEPSFFTRFFSWDFAKSAMHGNSFQRKLNILKNGLTPILLDKLKRRTPTTHVGRSSLPDKSQRSRSTSFSPDRVRVRGRSPAFNALAANFENPSARNLSTPPPVVRKLYPKSTTPDSPANVAPKAEAIAALTATFERPTQTMIPKMTKVSPVTSTKKPETNSKESVNVMNSRIESLSIQEDVKEGEAEDDQGPIFPYERLKTTSSNPVSEIDITKRETYLSSVEFKEKFGMTKNAFYKLPKWKQNKLKMALQLF